MVVESRRPHFLPRSERGRAGRAITRSLLSSPCPPSTSSASFISLFLSEKCSHSPYGAVMTVQLLQNAKAPSAVTPVVAVTTATGGISCGKLDPASVDAPENAVLYLSLRGSGVITYKCVEANKPVVLSEEADLTETLSKGWSGKIETKDGARFVLLRLCTPSLMQTPGSGHVVTAKRSKQ